jgi:hypothetical protein
MVFNYQGRFNQKLVYQAKFIFDKDIAKRFMI